MATEAASPFEPQRLPPVVRFEEVPQLQRFFPHGAPLVQLLVTAFEPREGEAAHLTPLQRDASASIEVGGCTPVRALAVAALGGSGGGKHTWTTHYPPCWWGNTALGVPSQAAVNTRCKLSEVALQQDASAGVRRP